jgi:hypothetical protein
LAWLSAMRPSPLAIRASACFEQRGLCEPLAIRDWRRG